MAEPRAEFNIDSSRPTLRDLLNHVIPYAKMKWFNLGLQLLPRDSKYETELNTIEADTKNDAETCCRKMFSKWLSTDELANWDKLINALKIVQLNSLAKDIERMLQRVTSVPLLKDLREHITPMYAVHWKLLGTLLKLPNDLLGMIESRLCEAIPCCNAMFTHWLELDTNASWEKVFSAIKSPLMYKARALHKGSVFEGGNTLVPKGDAISLLSNRVSQVSIQRHLMLDENMWPPEQPKGFSPLLLLQYQHQKSPEEYTALNKWIQAGNIDTIPSIVEKHHLELKGTKGTDIKAGYHKTLQKFFDSSTFTKEVTTILLPFDTKDEPCFILIEGPPGIGKSLLLKEIAYKWAEKQVLKTFKLVLLVCLRYPVFHDAKSVSDLILCFCEGDLKATEISTECSDYFFQNNGKDLLFLFDGFDELPKEFQTNSLIAKILQRKVLPNCGLIVSSRPHVSAYLRDYAKHKVDILGFGKTEQWDYIKKAFTRDPKKVEELTAYLSHHTTICNLCFVPYNMVVLVYLHNKGMKLPENFVDLYNYFISLTICHHLAKKGHPLKNTITDITNLPDPYNKVIKQLSKFSLEALNRQKLIFTLNEIKIACPDILKIPGAINGFGLLQAVQSFGLTEETLNFNFVHYSVQEFLAAHHIAYLSQRDKLQALHDISCNSDILFLCIAIKGKTGFSYKLFLSGGDRKMAISEKFLTDQLQCLRLYRCFNEINEKEICISIEKAAVFNPRNINLRHFTLTAYDVECIADFIMTSYHKEWNKLWLDGCYIQDHGICILQCLSNVTVTMLNLDNNGLTSSSSSVISDITTKCRVEWLSIAGNSSIGEDSILYSMLSSTFSVLKELYMQRTNLSSNAAKHLFAALKTDKAKLQILNIMNNDITDDACDAITDAIKRNTSLCVLKMQCNPISKKSAHNILEALLVNNILQVLGLPEYTRKIQDEIELSKERVNKKRKNLKYPLLKEIKYS